MLQSVKVTMTKNGGLDFYKFAKDNLELAELTADDLRNIARFLDTMNGK